MLPKISEEVIAAWVGTKAFQRGFRYYEDGAILNPRKRGAGLIAECQGSQPAPYRVEIHLSSEGIAWGICTCPGGEGGHCKHAAALLLTWVFEPESFSEVPELEKVLENQSKSELIALMQQMVARHPDLEQLLELSAMSNIPEGQELQPDQIIQQVRRAFSSAGGEWGDNAIIAENLQSVLDLGEDFLEKEDLKNAAIVFQNLMDTLLTYEVSLFNDEGGDLNQVLAQCEQGIQECLEASEEAELRLSLLRTLYEFFLWDLHEGGLGFADETPSILVNQSSPEEKKQMADWLQTEMPEGEEWNIQYQRRVLGGLWLNLLADGMNDETYLRICKETGRTQDMVDRLLSLSRVEEALEVARAEQGYYITAMADLFEKHNRPEIGQQLVREQPGSESEVLLLEWLKHYAVRHNQPEEALRLAELLFWRAQSLENYNALLEAAQTLNEGENTRRQVLEGLESAGNFSLLVEIYLLENEIDQALTALERVNPEIWWDRISGLRRQLALAVEQPRPREAIRQYLLLAEELIERRNRGSYAEAARFLQQVRKLYQGLGEAENWGSLISSLNQEYRRLPALHDELRRAGLLDR